MAEWLADVTVETSLRIAVAFPAPPFGAKGNGGLPVTTQSVAKQPPSVHDVHATCGQRKRTGTGRTAFRSSGTFGRLLRRMHLHPMGGNGWKVVILNEDDRIPPQAEVMWLDGLERLQTTRRRVTDGRNLLQRRRCDPSRCY